MEEEQRHEPRGGESPGDTALQGAAADAQQRLDDKYQHGAFQTEEQGIDDRHLAGQRVDQRQGQHDEGARQDENDARRQTAFHAMHRPAEVGGELLRLRPRQQVAETERVQKTPLADPVPVLDHFFMQQGDLAGRPAKRQQTDFEPDAEGGGEGRHGVHTAVPGAGQLWVSPVASRAQR